MTVDSEALDALYEQARQVAGRAYAPYSGYAVGAAIRCSDGSVVTGCNVENASFGLTICAEQAACVAAVAAGQRSFDAVAVHVDGPDGQPCGACRQFLFEFAPDATIVYLRHGERQVRPLRELLADGFEPSALDNG